MVATLTPTSTAFNFFMSSLKGFAQKEELVALERKMIFSVVAFLCADRAIKAKHRRLLRAIRKKAKESGVNINDTVTPGATASSTYALLWQKRLHEAYDVGRKAGAEAARKSTFPLAHDMGYQEGLAAGKKMRTYHFSMVNRDINPVIASMETLRLVAEGVEVYQFAIAFRDNFFDHTDGVLSYVTLGVPIGVMADIARRNHREVVAVNRNCELLINGKKYAGSIEIDFNTGQGTFSVT